MGRSTERGDRVERAAEVSEFTASRSWRSCWPGCEATAAVRDAVPGARDRGDALLRVAGQAARGRPSRPGRQGGAPGRAGAEEADRAAGAGSGSQDLRAGDRGGSIAGMGVRARAARSRELIAEGRRPAVVARVLQVNRSGLYRTPKRRPAAARRAVRRSGRPADRRGRSRQPDRRHPDGRGLGEPGARPPGQPQAGAAGDARSSGCCNGTGRCAGGAVPASSGSSGPTSSGTST